MFGLRRSKVTEIAPVDGRVQDVRIVKPADAPVVIPAVTPDKSSEPVNPEPFHRAYYNEDPAFPVDVSWVYDYITSNDYIEATQELEGGLLCITTVYKLVYAEHEIKLTYLDSLSYSYGVTFNFRNRVKVVQLDLFGGDDVEYPLPSDKSVEVRARDITFESFSKLAWAIKWRVMKAEANKLQAKIDNVK